MMRLVFSDLRDHAATWIGTFLVAVGCGYIGGLGGAQRQRGDCGNISKLR